MNSEKKEKITKGDDTVANDVDDVALRRDSWHPENEVEDNDEDLSTLRLPCYIYLGGIRVYRCCERNRLSHARSFNVYAS